jgi:hypothetical protein
VKHIEGGVSFDTLCPFLTPYTYPNSIVALVNWAIKVRTLDFYLPPPLAWPGLTKLGCVVDNTIIYDLLLFIIVIRGPF